MNLAHNDSESLWLWTIAIGSIETMGQTAGNWTQDLRPDKYKHVQASERQKQWSTDLYKIWRVEIGKLITSNFSSRNIPMELEIIRKVVNSPRCLKRTGCNETLLAGQFKHLAETETQKPKIQKLLICDCCWHV
jgi:hypothetical protein